MAFNWIRLQTPFQQAQAWNLRQQALRQQLEYQADVTNTLTGAGRDEDKGRMNLVVQEALARVKAARPEKGR